MMLRLHMANLTKLVNVLLIYNGKLNWTVYIVSTECQPKEELYYNCS